MKLVELGKSDTSPFIRHADGNPFVDPVEPSDEDLDEMARQGVARIRITDRNRSHATKSCALWKTTR
jgi:hypothetical protein